MKPIVIILISFSFFSLRASFQKSAILEKGIDPSLLSQVDSYYDDLYKTFSSQTPKKNLDQPIKELHQEELNAYKLIKELSKGFQRNTTQKTNNNKNITTLIENAKESFLNSSLLLIEKEKDSSLFNNFSLGLDVEQKISLWNNVPNDVENGNDIHLLDNKTIDGHIIMKNDSFFVKNETEFSNYNNEKVTMFPQNNFLDQNLTQNLPKFLQNKPLSNKDTLNELFPPFQGLNNQKNTISEASFFTEKMQIPVILYKFVVFLFEFCKKNINRILLKSIKTIY